MYYETILAYTYAVSGALFVLSYASYHFFLKVWPLAYLMAILNLTSALLILLPKYL